MQKLNELTAAIKAAVGEVETKLGEIRAEITTLKAERETVAAAPVTKALALSRLDAKLAAEAAKFDVDGSFIDRLWRPDLGDEPLGLVDIFVGEAHQSNNLEPMLAALFGDQLRKALATRVESEYKAITKQGITPIGDEERAERLHEIDARIADLEEAEESIRAEAAQAGIDLAPRPDISAEAFLEIDDGEDADQQDAAQ
ncbi:hypothetical protein [Dongia sp.]|uniref:hypothetical protein n=1 Tax=Dongia sp. TaxID=1977262 RepID=UPI0035B333BE